MKWQVGIILAALCLTSTNCLAELKYEEFDHSYKMAEKSNNTQVMNNYLIGLYEGIKASNISYYMQTKEFLYCKPTDFELNANDIRKIIEEAHESYNSTGDIPVSYLLFVGLKQTFPCF